MIDKIIYTALSILSMSSALAMEVTLLPEEVYNQIALSLKETNLEGVGVNVHDFNKQFIKDHYPLVINIMKKEYPDMFSLEAIRAGIDQYLSGRQDAAEWKSAINKTLDLIAQYWNHPVDEETGINLQEALSMGYALAQNDADMMYTLCSNLAENIEEKGGCHSGINGRLGKMFIDYFRTQHENIKQQEEDDALLQAQLSRAMEESLLYEDNRDGS